MGLPRRASKGPASSAEILAHMAASVLEDHKYGSLQNPDTPDTGLEHSMLTEGNPSDSLSSDSDQDQIELKPAGKLKSRNIQESDQILCNLSFDPENIKHPRSTEWIPCAEVAHYVQDRIWKGFDRDVCNTLQSECPRPSLQGKMAETPELDPNMATFIKGFSKDPKKGLDRAWKSCQDKLLDISCRLTKILELGVQAKEADTIDPQAILDWTQRAMCWHN
ncbi:hypothetical protein NDU88_002105 [Pleurodeles waltl]|uniref:Uncharacterized protein n=1 Tax=Pleurodeles waltl TaxID=8319 RepID=A0AAV7TJP6_PLEWA|nr:hypothetical protein NDU88_002105 [Pleurodeles waltl]